MIHVSGAGLLGAFVLAELARRGVEFTWWDVETQYAAWRASTGAVIPCEERDGTILAEGYRFWRDFAVAREDLAPYAEPVETIYVQRNPPARVTRRWKPVLWGANRIWRESLPGWQFNVDAFVSATRRLYASRRAQPSPGDTVLRCHGCMERTNRPIVVWGWRVAASIRPTLLCQVWSTGAARPVIHFNDLARTFERYYFHPIAGEADWWWAGSEAVLQRAPEHAEQRFREGFARYRATVAERFGDQLLVSYDEARWSEGWRAKPRTVHETLGRHLYQDGKAWVAQPLYKSGVQCGPLVAARIAERLCA